MQLEVSCESFSMFIYIIAVFEGCLCCSSWDKRRTALQPLLSGLANHNCPLLDSDWLIDWLIDDALLSDQVWNSSCITEKTIMFTVTIYTHCSGHVWDNERERENETMLCWFKEECEQIFSGYGQHMQCVLILFDILSPFLSNSLTVIETCRQYLIPQHVGVGGWCVYR